VLTAEPPGMLATHASITDVENLRALMQSPEVSTPGVEGGPAATCSTS